MINLEPRGHRTALVLTCLILLTVAACGGGGDSGGGNGGGGGGGSGLSFSLNRNSIAFDYTEVGAGVSLPMEEVTATAQGTYNGTLFVGAIVEGTAINPSIPTFLSGVQGTFQISPMPGLAPGNYSGRILLLACSDAACNNRLGNTPLAVSYTVRVRAALKVSPGPLVDIDAVSGTEGQRSFTVQLPDGATSFTPSMFSGADTFRIADVTPTSFRVIARSLPPNSYFGQVRIDAAPFWTIIDLNYRVGVPPGGTHNLSVAPTDLTFATTEGGSSAPALLTVTPANWDPVHHATVQYHGGAADWLSVTNMAGGYQLVANGVNLTAGSYTANVIIGGASPIAHVVIPAALTVGVGLVRPADIVRVISASTTPAGLAGSTRIDIATGTPVGWLATSSTSWLSLTRSSGQTGTDLMFTLDTPAFEALENGEEHIAQVTVTSDRPTMTPITFDVRVTKKLAQVTGLGPYLHASNRPLRMIIRGVGFDAVTDLDAAITVEGASNPTFTRVNDTEIIVQAPAMAAGSYAVTAANPLGAVDTGRILRVMAPQPYIYDTFPTGGDFGTMLYDAERSAMYLANTGLGSLQRYKYSSGTWVLDTVAVPSIADIGLTNDGASIIVGTTSSTSTLRLLDANQTSSFVEQAHFDVPNLGVGNDGIPVTNDGHAWFSMQTSRFGYFDFEAGTYNDVTPSFHSGARFQLARDGERLVVSSNSTSSPVLYLDAKDNVVHTSPASTDFFHWKHSSDDGDRVVYDRFIVLDRNFARIGTLALVPMGWVGMAAVVSPDGSRTYALSYNEGDLDQFPATFKPRVYVFDSSTRPPTQAELPALGYFEIDDYPTCREFFLCDTRPRFAISPDGGTLFFAGSELFVVVPIPAEGTLSPMRAPGGGVSIQSAGSGIRTHAWRLELSAR